MYTFKIVALNQISNSNLYGFQGKYLFTTREWLEFVMVDSKVKPLIIEISSESKFVGYLYGFTFMMFGIKIFGSPFNGWSTCYMGLDLKSGEKLSVVKEIVDYLFSKCGVLYAEITDRDFNVDEAIKMGYTVKSLGTLQLELGTNKTDDELMMLFKTKCRNLIRQFKKRGASAEIAAPNDQFAEEYFDQLKDVFAKQGMVPTYSVKKVKNLINALSPTDNLLCVRIKDPEGNSIASSIFLGYGDTFYFWGGASYRSGQHYLPNEYMIWIAIKHFYSKGMTHFDMVGIRDYKRKFGSVERYYPKLVFSKISFLVTFRDLTLKAYFALLHIKGFLKRQIQKW